MVIAERDGQMKIFSDERLDKGFYVLQISSVLDNLDLFANHNGLFSFSEIDKINPPSDLIYQASFLLTLEMEEPNSEIQDQDNIAPFFIPEPTDLFAYYS